MLLARLAPLVALIAAAGASSGVEPRLLSLHDSDIHQDQQALLEAVQELREQQGDDDGHLRIEVGSNVIKLMSDEDEDEAGARETVIGEVAVHGEARRELESVLRVAEASVEAEEGKKPRQRRGSSDAEHDAVVVGSSSSSSSSSGANRGHGHSSLSRRIAPGQCLNHPCEEGDASECPQGCTSCTEVIVDSVTAYRCFP